MEEFMSKTYVVECYHSCDDSKYILKATSNIHVEIIINYLKRLNITSNSKIKLLDKVS